MKLLAPFIAFLASLVLMVTPAHAAVVSMTPFGGASVSGNSATLVSDLSNTGTTDDFSGVGLNIPSGMLFSNLTNLSTTFNVTDDNCGGGSPRFQVHLNTPDGVKTMFVYLGPSPDFNSCAAGDQSSGNLIGSTDARFDLTRFGGPFMGTYADALSRVGSFSIAGIQLVADSGWMFPDSEQTITVSNPDVAFKVATAKDQCKDNGFTAFSNPSFKNQGQCVAFFASGGKNIK